MTLQEGVRVLTWVKSTDPLVAKYRIYRMRGSAGWDLLDVVSASKDSYKDEAAGDGNFRYLVVAENKYGMFEEP